MVDTSVQNAAVYDKFQFERNGYFSVDPDSKPGQVCTSLWSLTFVSCRLDYCNSVPYGLLDTLLRKLQSVQNATARLITGMRCRDHITPLLHELHWLPIREHVKFKVAYLVHQSLSGQASLYTADDFWQHSALSAVSWCSDLLGATKAQLGDRTFAAAGPRLWNSLLCNPDITYRLFRQQLKVHLLALQEHGARDFRCAAPWENTC